MDHSATLAEPPSVDAQSRDNQNVGGVESTQPKDIDVDDLQESYLVSAISNHSTLTEGQATSVLSSRSTEDGKDKHKCQVIEAPFLRVRMKLLTGPAFDEEPPNIPERSLPDTTGQPDPEGVLARRTSAISSYTAPVSHTAHLPYEVDALDEHRSVCEQFFHFDYVVLTGGTTKCDECNAKSRGQVYKCLQCVAQICGDCVEREITRERQYVDHLFTWRGGRAHGSFKGAYLERKAMNDKKAEYEGWITFSTDVYRSRVYQIYTTIQVPPDTAGPTRKARNKSKTVISNAANLLGSRYAEDLANKPGRPLFDRAKGKDVEDDNDATIDVNEESMGRNSSRYNKLQAIKQAAAVASTTKLQPAPTTTTITAQPHPHLDLAEPARQYPDIAARTAASKIAAGRTVNPYEEYTRRSHSVPRTTEVANIDWKANDGVPNPIDYAGEAARVVLETVHFSNGKDIFWQPMTAQQRSLYAQSKLLPTDKQIRFDAGDKFDQYGKYIGKNEYARSDVEMGGEGAPVAHRPEPVDARVQEWVRDETREEEEGRDTESDMEMEDV